AGTASGTTVTNTVTLSYQVGGVGQNDVTASNSFTVDRKINLTVAEVGSATTTVSPGETAAVTTFTVTNTSNATLDFALAVAQQSGGAGAHSNTDNFDVTTPTVYVDTNGNGSYDAGTDTTASYLDEVTADGSKTVFVVSAIPLGRATGDVAAVTLSATAREGGAAASQGAAITETAGANTAGVDTVFADGAGATDAARDASYSAKDDYTVSAANLTVAKVSTIISDPINNSTNPKMIPGAVVEYCIQISNAAGGASATNISVSDVLPTETTYNSSFGILTGGTVSGATCSGGATGSGSYNGGTRTVSATVGTVNAGASTAVRFQVTVN
ncbi:MAG: hypothetical protein ACM3YM_01825, partial [Sphingomonadales bacterium]